MASCTQIDRLLQAYIDGELPVSERVILEEHVAACPACTALLRKHQRSAAFLFDTFRPYRLAESLRQRVLESLPEMEYRPSDLESVNWRAKHPASLWQRIARWVPVAAGIVLVILATVIYLHLPKPLPSNGSIGVVMQDTGGATRIAAATAERHAALVAEFVEPGDRFETEEESSLMLSLAGPTEIKLNSDTRVRVIDHRTVDLEKGEVWMNISRDRQLFRLKTPAGDITVFGTKLNVRTDSALTTVCVERGQVHVESGSAFRMVETGYAVDMAPGEEPSQPRPVDLDTVIHWADDIAPQKVASEMFNQFIMPKGQTAELPAEEMFVVDMSRVERPFAVGAIWLSWQPDNVPSDRCTYDVYVYDGKMNPLFKKRVPAEILADKSRNSFEMTVPNGPIRGLKLLHVRLVPDFSTGHAETELLVSAQGS